jgi:hypothetical protein
MWLWLCNLFAQGHDLISEMSCAAWPHVSHYSTIAGVIACRSALNAVTKFPEPSPYSGSTVTGNCAASASPLLMLTSPRICFRTLQWTTLRMSVDKR